jgi:CHASE2 domain-containing sensor protein
LSLPPPSPPPPPPPPPTRKNGEKALILRALCARKMSALNEKMQKWDAPDVFRETEYITHQKIAMNLLNTGYMSRVAVLKIGQGSFAQGFAVTLQLREDQGAPIAELEGRLPANPEISSLYLCWQQAFRSLAGRDRSSSLLHQAIDGLTPDRATPDRATPTAQSDATDDWEVDQNLITHRSTREDVEVCRQFAKALEASMKTWLQSHPTEGWQRIRERLARELASYPDRFRLVIQTRDSQLWKLPWQTWDLLSHYPQVGVGYSLPDFEQQEQRDRPHLHAKPVRILAVLGNTFQLNLQPDETAIENLEQADAVFLHQPTAQEMIRELRSDRGWDIFFFAGHSQSEFQSEFQAEFQAGNDDVEIKNETLQTGRIYLNDQESLEIDQFRHALRDAIHKGLKIAIFNSCDGLGLAQRSANLNIPVVICMQERVPDQVAQSFLKEFLIEYAKDQPLYTAVRRSQDRLEEFQHLPGATWLPLIYQNPAEIPPTWQALRGLAISNLNHAQRTDLEAQSAQILTGSKSKVGLRFVLLLSLLITGLVTWVRSQGNLQTWELQTFDQVMRQQPIEPVDQRLLIVGADEEDIRQYGFPIPDATLAQLLEKLNQSKPAAIGVDIVRDQPVEPGHQQLMANLKQNPSIVSICSIDTSLETSIAPPAGLTEPQIGFVDLHGDDVQTKNQDATIRRYLLSRTANPVNTPSRCATPYSFALQLIGRYLTLKKIPITVQADQWQFGAIAIPRLATHSGGYQNLDDQGNQLLIRYRHTVDPQQIARQITFRDVLSNSNEFKPDLVDGRVVLVGVTAPSIPDLHNTPYGRLRGLQIHAHMVSQLISTVADQRALIRWLPPWGDAIWILGWSLVGGVMVWRLMMIPLSLQTLALGSTVLLLYGCCWVALTQGLWLPLVPTAIALTLTSSAVAIANKIESPSLESLIQ